MNEIFLGDYRIVRNTSIFSRRNNANVKLQDITIQITDDRQYGVVKNGKHYNYIAIIKAESGEIIRGTVDNIPDYIWRIVEIEMEQTNAH